MEKHTYKLVFTFDTQNPEICKKVQERLSNLSSKSSDQMETILEHGRVVLKKNADPEADQHLAALLENTGGVCRFEKIPIDHQIAKISRGESGTVHQDGKNPAHSEITCPRCKRLQPLRVECFYCGVIIEKAKNRVLPPCIEIKSNPGLKTEPPQTPKTQWDQMAAGYNQCIKLIRNWLDNDSPGKRKMQRWSQRVANDISRCGVAFIIAGILEIALLYLGDAMWFVYTSTPAGQHYMASGDLAQSILHVTQMSLTSLGFRATLAALMACLIVGLVGQLFHLIRYFHEPLGLLPKLVFWGLPQAGVTAWLINYQDPAIGFEIAYLVAVSPTLLLVNRSYAIIQTFVPELGTIIHFLVTQSVPGTIKITNSIKIRLKSSFGSGEPEA